MTANAIFQMRGTSDLERQGLFGNRIEVALRGDALVLSGLDGRSLRIEAGDAARLRLGVEDSESGLFFSTLLWRASSSEPIRLAPWEADDPLYGAVIRGFARAMAAQGHLARVERGLSRLGSLFLPALMIAPAIVYTILLLLIGLDDPEFLGWILSDLAFWGFGLWALSWWRKHRSVRPLHDLSEIDGLLPPGTLRS